MRTFHRLIVLCALLLPGLLPAQTNQWSMSTGDAVVLGVVEGLTEYLPVSSTGHLILTERVLGLGDDPATKNAADSFTIVIQMGAILAVIAVYSDHLWLMLLGVCGRSREGLRLVVNLLLAFLPAAVVGLLFVDSIKRVLFGLWPVTAAWLVGGVALVIWGHKTKDGPDSNGLTMKDLTPRKALCIGLMQTLAVWPGTSRSLVTILGGRWVGLTLRDSVIFSFLLGMVTLTASTGYDLLKNGSELLGVFGIGNLLVGTVTACLSAWVAVKGMVSYLKRHGLGVFGGYRIVLALVTAALLLTGKLSP